MGAPMTVLERGPVPGRACNSCSLCCRLLHVEELRKPAGKWCEFCKPGHGGCSIYEARPPICRNFYCGWLISSKVSNDWFPLDCHMILSLGVFNGIQCVTCTVDPDYADAWKQPPFYQQLKMMALRGLKVDLPEQILLVHIRCHDRVWLLLPDRDAEISHGSYIVKLVGEGRWDIEQFDSNEAAADRVADLMN